MTDEITSLPEAISSNRIFLQKKTMDNSRLDLEAKSRYKENGIYGHREVVNSQLLSFSCTLNDMLNRASYPQTEDTGVTSYSETMPPRDHVED